MQDAATRGVPLTNAEAWAIVAATRAARIAGTRYDPARTVGGATAAPQSSPALATSGAASQLPETAEALRLGRRRQPRPPLFPSSAVGEHEVHVLYYLREVAAAERAFRTGRPEGSPSEAATGAASGPPLVVAACGRAVTRLLSDARPALGGRLTAPEALQLCNLRPVDARGVYAVLPDLEARLLPPGGGDVAHAAAEVVEAAAQAAVDAVVAAVSELRPGAVVPRAAPEGRGRRAGVR